MMIEPARNKSHCTTVMLCNVLCSWQLLATFFLSVANGQLHSDTPARYVRLPPLREQAAILDSWRDERIANIPVLLKKYGVSAWLVRPLCADITSVEPLNLSHCLFLLR